MQYLPKQDLAKFLRAAYTDTKNRKHLIHHAAMLVSFFTGARISQVLNVRGEDIFQLDGKWTIKIRAAKRGNVRTYSLHLDADPAFDMSPLIAMAKIKGLSKIFGGLSRQAFNKALTHYAHVAGIHSDYAHSHIFRHSAAMVVFDATQRIGAVSRFLAHRSPASAFVYLQENDGLLAQDAMDNLQLAQTFAAATQERQKR
jgi:integrase